MKRILLCVAYDGTNYSGWQLQDNAPTIEGELNKALSNLHGEKITVIGASRTDAGVHALCNMAVYDTDARMPGEKVSLALNTVLPEDIKAVWSREVAPDFHPRHTNTVKTYEY
ncbi:MAG: tRNA pseudouridine(38-40) synthase TruA, partial [Lachnospiraceae bacterium]|nr:tRNA pseudouridine(38-40) synthase TruA [Lachnospiraceae bacterium]